MPGTKVVPGRLQPCSDRSEGITRKVGCIMRKVIASTLLAFSFLLTGCGGDSYDSLTDEIIGVLNGLPAIMESIQDEASAKAAAEKFKQLTAKMEDITTRGKALGDPPKEKQEELKKRIEAAQKSIDPKMEAAMKRLQSKPELLMILMEPIMEMQRKLGQ